MTFSPTQKDNVINGVRKKSTDLVPPPSQGELFHSEKHVMRNGIEMGVLDNGMPYLSEKGLAHMCDIDRKALNAIGSDWINERLKTRGKKNIRPPQ